MTETICENCSKEIDTDEAQLCELCEIDGLGNCCISVLDHRCDGPEPGTPVTVDYEVAGGAGKVTSARGEFVAAKGSIAEVMTAHGIVVGSLQTVRRLDAELGG